MAPEFDWPTSCLGGGDFSDSKRADSLQLLLILILTALAMNHRTRRAAFSGLFARPSHSMRC
jgi:hypothetical protein